MSKKGLVRLDDLLIQRGLAADPREAQSLIMAGLVVVVDQRVDKPGRTFAPDIDIRIKPRRGPYVSRAGEKLHGALLDFDLVKALDGAVVLDVGASTGGFTDCCLKHGAKRVYAVDVGTNQLEWSLRQDERVTVFEQTDIRNFSLQGLEIPSICVVDVSFIGIRNVWESLVRLFNQLRRVTFIILVKPQFELERAKVPQGGIVTDEPSRLAAVDGVMTLLREAGFEEVRSCPSRVLGRSGNQEYFVTGRRVWDD